MRYHATPQYRPRTRLAWPSCPTVLNLLRGFSLDNARSLAHDGGRGQFHGHTASCRSYIPFVGKAASALQSRVRNSAGHLAAVCGAVAPQSDDARLSGSSSTLKPGQRAYPLTARCCPADFRHAHKVGLVQRESAKTRSPREGSVKGAGTDTSNTAPGACWAIITERMKP
jgi:hypothetical protein